MMNILHGLKDQGHLEVGGFLEGFSDMEAMRPPFLAPTKPPSRAAQKVVVVADPVAPARAAPSAAAKPKFFMDRGATTGKSALLSACSNLGCRECTVTFDGMGMNEVRRTDCAYVFSKTTGKLKAGGVKGCMTIAERDASYAGGDWETAESHTECFADPDDCKVLDCSECHTEGVGHCEMVRDTSTSANTQLCMTYNANSNQATAQKSYNAKVKEVALEGQCTPCSQLTTCSKCLEQGPDSPLAATMNSGPRDFSKIVEYCSWVSTGTPGSDFCTTASMADTYATDYKGYTAVKDSATCDKPAVTESACSTYKECYKCRSADSGECYWNQAENADETGDYSGSCGDEYISGSTNSSCQSPEASNQGTATCKEAAQKYMPGYIGYFFLLIGATLQLLGVCSWCGVKPEARSNVNLLCSGCNIHWIAGLVLLIWGCTYLAAYSAALSMFFGIVAAYLLPCLIAPCAGIIGVRINSNHNVYYTFPSTHTVLLTFPPLSSIFSSPLFARQRPVRVLCRLIRQPSCREQRLDQAVGGGGNVAVAGGRFHHHKTRFTEYDISST